MSAQLILLTIFAAALGLSAVIRPATLFQYPVAAGLLMMGFVLPQAWTIERSGIGRDYDPPSAWIYMTLCLAMLLLGFALTAYRGAKATSTAPRRTIETFLETYDVERVFKACAALVAIGTVAWVLMLRDAEAATASSAQWTGVITLYALLTSLLLFGASLAWLLYLYTRDRKSLMLAVFGLSFSVPTVLFSARRELAFELVTSLLLGLFFVRGKSVSRFLLIPMMLVGTVYVNQASAIRSYIKNNDASLVGALTSNEVASDITSGGHTSEVMFAVSDIALTQWSGEYVYFAPYWNTMVQLYFPAFIFGREAKDHAKFDFNLYVNRHAFTAENGATHTGFSDSFVEFHYLGAGLFFAIAAILGFVWRRAREGDIGAQFFYMVLLTEGMMTITESTSRFVGKVPFLFGVMGLAFWYARRPRKRAEAVFTGVALSPAAQHARNATRLSIER